MTTDKYHLDIRTSVYDRVSGALATGVLVFGALALLQLVTWLTTFSSSSNGDWRSVPPFKPGEPGNESALGVEHELLPPGVKDFPEVDVPQLANAIQSVTSAPSRLAALLANFDGDKRKMGDGPGPGSKDKDGTDGNSRAYERWSIEYESEDFQTYLKQLTTLGVQIGAVDKVLDQVDLILDLASQPTTRQVRRSDEQRVYFVHTDGKLQHFDLRCARRAGIDAGGKIMVQFYSPETAQQLTQLEMAEAERRGIDAQSIRRTIFKVREAGSGFEFYVADMQQM